MKSETTDNPQPPDGSTSEEVTGYLEYLAQRDLYPSIGADVLPFKIHVRTRLKIAHAMIARDVDAPHDVLVKATWDRPDKVVVLEGWLLGRECRRAEWRQKHNGAVVWFVPSGALRDMRQLTKLVEKWRTDRQPRK